MRAITKTEFDFPKQSGVYNGKVRDLYTIDEKYLVMVATDRISAFDVILPEGIPFKGEILNKIASKALDETVDIVPNWKIASPDPMVTVGYKCTPYPIEMVVRGYLTGSSWRLYRDGGREICGITLPEGLQEHQQFDHPLLTPTTKGEVGQHDENISREEIIAKGLVPEEEYLELERISLQLFKRGGEIAAKRGLILVDTKYEFGKLGDKIVLIDEIHTPDSSRYFYADSYQELFEKGEQQRQLSKEFVREWLMERGFQGREGEIIPEMDRERINSISQRYIELYEKITGVPFTKESAKEEDPYLRIDSNVRNMLARL